jgi:Mce-associated membrane protein
VTAVLDNTTAATKSAETTSDDAGRPASWGSRAGAFAVDVFLGGGAVAALVLVAWSTAQRDWLWWVCVCTAGLVLLAVAVNRLLLPPVTGWSLGRALAGIAVVGRAGDVVGPWRLLLRDIAHLLDTAALFIGWLWPLWDSRGRTFADMLVRTEVHRTASRPRRARRWAVIAAAVIAAVAVAAATLGYGVVYRQDRAVAEARAQIAVQGPKIVAQMLSYDPSSLQADFARAQSLVTDGYRPQLVAQQEAVRKAPIVANEYWVTNSAVLTSTADSATTLLLLQGQRGVPPNQRIITATVKVNFARSGAGVWQVADLTVLAKPAVGP